MGPRASDTTDSASYQSFFPLWNLLYAPRMMEVQAAWGTHVLGDSNLEVLTPQGTVVQ